MTLIFIGPPDLLNLKRLCEYSPLLRVVSGGKGCVSDLHEHGKFRRLQSSQTSGKWVVQCRRAALTFYPVASFVKIWLVAAGGVGSMVSIPRW